MGRLVAATVRRGVLFPVVASPFSAVVPYRPLKLLGPPAPTTAETMARIGTESQPRRAARQGGDVPEYAPGRRAGRVDAAAVDRVMLQIWRRCCAADVSRVLNRVPRRYVFATGSGKTSARTFAFGPSSRCWHLTTVTGSSLKKVHLFFSPVGGGYQKDFTLLNVDAALLDKRFGLARKVGDGTYARGGPAATVLLKSIKARLA